jgi:integrase
MARVRGPGVSTAKGIPWDVCWTDVDGRERSKRFYDKDKAYKEAGRIEDQLRRGENTDPRAGRKTFREVAEEWLATRTKAMPATVANYRNQLKLHAFPALGDRRIASLTAADIGRFVSSLRTTERGKPRRPAGFERIMFPVRAILAYAVEEGYITRNPARKVETPDEQTLGVEAFEGIALTPAQVAAIAQECGRCHPAGELIVWFVALTGLRAAEVGRLDISDLNVLHNFLTARRTKSAGRARRVDYSAALADRLKPYLAAHPSADDPAAPLFFGEVRGRLDPRCRFDPPRFYTAYYKPAVIAVGLASVRFHDLRHTAGSWWLEAGVSLETVSARLGHRDINFTRRTYIHALHTRTDEDAEKLDNWLAAQSGANVVPLRRAAG